MQDKTHSISGQTHVSIENVVAWTKPLLAKEILFQWPLSIRVIPKRRISGSYSFQPV